MNVAFENDFQKKVMVQTFSEPVTLASRADVLAWRSAWTAALKSWHSPYKAVIDCGPLMVADQPEVREALALMMRFFEGLFLKKAVGFNLDEAKGHGALPFTVFSDEAAALVEVGVREPPKPRQPQDFRAAIQIQNHFAQHVMELTFAHPILIATPEQLEVLKSKITNNLMQWHSKWNLLVDCANFEIAPEIGPDFEGMLKFFRGFFLKEVLGYSPRMAADLYPFKVYRARHNAAGRLEPEGLVGGDAVVCRSTKG
jgi:hypothetical protein